MLKYTINKFLDIRFEDGKTNIYVNNDLFRHCKYILLNISIDNVEYFADINSIDDAVEKLDRSFEFSEDQTGSITPEMLFWAHCSNLQAWYENNYNTYLIHSNLAFPLLKELTKAGDQIARKIFKEEIAKRFETNNITVIQFLLNGGYLDYLNKEETEFVLEGIRNKFSEIFINPLKKLIKRPFTNYNKIKNLMDTIIFIDLMYNENLVFSLYYELNQILRMRFARFLLLHLNFKEFINYKIPYGRYFTYFENIVDFLYKNDPEINDLLNIIDSGFLSGSLSLDEKFSYGAQSYP